MSRRTLAVFGLLLAVAPLSAQMKHEDHNMKVKGAGALPKGWMGRGDDGAKAEESKFVVMGTGWHVTSGPAAIYWNGLSTKGPFTATATLSQTKAPEHPEAYGLFFMGKDLKAKNQSYAYFIVRGDGKFMVNHRAGEEVHKIVPWTDNAAINKADAKGAATNILTVDASKSDSIRLLVNGKQVHALGGDHFGNTDGLVGVRVNHNLDVHISDLKVTPKK